MTVPDLSFAENKIFLLSHFRTLNYSKFIITYFNNINAALMIVPQNFGLYFKLLL